MGIYLQNLLSVLRGGLERLWAYLGTLAAMSLMLGTLGMGIYHLIIDDSRPAARVECFLGVFNSAGAEPPRGSLPLPAASAARCPHLSFEYGADGRLARVVHRDAHGHPTAMPGSQVAEQRLDYDAAGRLVRKSNLDARGRPVPDASGVSVREYGYDEAGRQVSTRFSDGQGRAVVPRMPGYAIARARYDNKGRPLCIEYLDAEGRPIVNAEGESRVEFAYDDALRSVRRSNLVQGRPTDNVQGYAVEHRQRSEDGSSLTLRWEDAGGRPALNPSTSASCLRREYDGAGNIRHERLCSAEGAPVAGTRSCAEHLTRRNVDGSVAWERFNAADGRPCMNPALGYAERMVEYGPASEMERELFWDERGNPAPCYERRHLAGEGGPAVLSLHRDGSTELSPR